MKDLTNDVQIYWSSKNSGYCIDKRTMLGKEIIEKVKTINSKNLVQIGYEFNLHPTLVMLRPKDINKFRDIYLN